jgi:hypothetical protein
MLFTLASCAAASQCSEAPLLMRDRQLGEVAPGAAMTSSVEFGAE